MPRRQVSDAHRALGLVDVLPAGAAGAVTRRCGSRSDRSSRRRARRPRAARRRCRRWCGCAPALRSQARAAPDVRPTRTSASSRHPRPRCARSPPCSRPARWRSRRSTLGLPAVALRVAQVHPQQAAGEQCRLVAAGAGPYSRGTRCDRRSDRLGSSRRCKSASSDSMRARAAWISSSASAFMSGSVSISCADSSSAQARLNSWKRTTTGSISARSWPSVRSLFRSRAVSSCASSPSISSSRRARWESLDFIESFIVRPEWARATAMGATASRP
jgi:hypothetical protein